MTESEWRECVDPWRMLADLGERAGARKKRLFACACVRRIRPLLADKRLRQALRLAERFADEQATPEQMRRALLLVSLLREELREREKRKGGWKALARRAAAQAVEGLLPVQGPHLERPRDVRDAPDVVTATRLARTAARAAEAQREKRRGRVSPVPPESPRRLRSLEAADLLREIFGNPFRAVPVDPFWLTHNENAAAKLARSIYDQRHFHDLPLLADALTEAGCEDAVILAHCRAPTKHVLGCWVIDTLLGMK
ncbi:MAG TPA: hypothetical protein VH575_07985 [Gemmataceae bacterium]|jgi:hypothetical protein